MELLKFNINDHSEKDIQFFSKYAQTKSKKVHPLTALAHYQTKYHLSKKTGVPIENIKFSFNKHGKPYYNNEIFFSISHSSDMVVIAFDDREIGVDIEKIKEINLKLLSKVASEQDKENFDYDNFDISFLKLWTLKEAYFKFAGTGITDLKSISQDGIRKSYYTETIIENNYILSIVKGR